MIFNVALLLILHLFPLNLQDDYQLVREIKVKGQQHYSDPLGNIYIIDGNEISRYNRQYQNVGRYSNAFLGQPVSLDVSDPMRLMVFYEVYNQLLWLDNFLTELRSPVLLDELGYEQVDVVCTSSQGGFWIYNSLTDQIHSFDASLNLVHESISLGPLLERSDRPVFMIEKNRNIYVSFLFSGILVFDRFGNYQRSIPVKGISRFQVEDNYFFYMRDAAFYSYSLIDGTETEIELPLEQEPEYAEWQSGLLYIYFKTKVTVFR